MNAGDLTTLQNAKDWLGLTGLVISAISNANPAVLTLAERPQTPLLSGAPYTVQGATGIAGIDGEWVITVLTPTTFSIPTDSTANGTYTGGAYVGISDPLIQRLISSTSAYIQNWLARTIANTSYVRTFNGQEMATMMLPQYPVTSIDALQVNGVDIPARPALTFPSTTSNGGGYTYQEHGQLALSGYVFARGYNNVAVSWSAGFLISEEAHTIPATAPYTCVTIARWSAGDRGVVYASSGAALTRVTGAPAMGEYAVDSTDWSVYTFNAADAGIGVLISYAYVPYDIEQACIDMLGDWFKYRARIGVTSMGIEGQTISYTNTPMTARAKGVLEQYRKVMTL